MSAYYNENDPFAAQWLRSLIREGLIAPGDVDDRSIADVAPADLEGYTQAHFFAGIGGWSLALRLAGWPDGRPVWTGSCPCQPFSSAGKRKGFDDERHLWPTWHGLIRECRPAIVFGEQVAGAAGYTWLDAVRVDLEDCGYAVAAVDLPACSVGAPHRRQRLWWVGDSTHDGQPREQGARAGGTGAPHNGWVGDSQSGRGCPRITTESREHCENAREERLQEPLPGRGVDGGGLADPDQAGQRGSEERDQRQERGREAVPDRDDADGRGVVRGLGNADRVSEGAERGTGQEQGAPPTRASRLAHADGGQPGHGGLQPGGEHGLVPQDGGSPWQDIEWIACADGRTRPVPAAQRGFLTLADGFWYRVATVRAEIVAQAIGAVTRYAQNSGTRPEEVLSMVQQAFVSQEVREGAPGGSGELPEAEVLLTFVQRLQAALCETVIGSSGEEARPETCRVVLRDVRSQVESMCSPPRQRSPEQHAAESADPLHELSLFLARCCAESEGLDARAHAAAFPLSPASPGRVGILRGAGNAIVAPLAAEFIRAYLDTQA